MARVINRIENMDCLSVSEKRVRDFLTAALPDYITIGFELVVNNICLDVVLFIPHMGVFILEIKSGHLVRQDGQYMMQFMNGRRVHFDPLKTKHVAVEMTRYMRETFRINPLVYELNCFVNLQVDEQGREMLHEMEDHYLLEEDFRSAKAFMRKIYRFYTEYGSLMSDAEKTEAGRNYYEDLDDEMVGFLSSYWFQKPLTGKRPENPPLAFLSYNSNNQSMAKRIQKELEKQGIFTWKAPLDVPFGEDYLAHETRAIESCDAFVLLLTGASQESEEVRYEVELAIAKKKKIFPVVWGEYQPNEYYKNALRAIEWRVVENEDLSFLSEIVAYLKKMGD